MWLGNDGLGSRDRPWDARFRGAEKYLDPLHPTSANVVGQPYRGIAQLEAFIVRLAQVAMKMEWTSAFTHHNDNHTLIQTLFKCLTRNVGVPFFGLIGLSSGRWT